MWCFPLLTASWQKNIYIYKCNILFLKTQVKIVKIKLIEKLLNIKTEILRKNDLAK